MCQPSFMQPAKLKAQPIAIPDGKAACLSRLVVKESHTHSRLRTIAEIPRDMESNRLDSFIRREQNKNINGESQQIPRCLGMMMSAYKEHGK